MKKIVLNKAYLTLTALVAFLLSSCLKDEGFEEGRYGTINTNTEGQRFISIPLGAFTANPIGVESKAGAQPVSLFPVSFDFKEPASSDITATVQVNNDLVKAADSTAVLLPASSYTVSSTNLVVKAGQRISEPLTINLNTSQLDPSKKYGIGFTLTSVSDPSINMPANLKNVVFVFTIKNKYDGVYRFKGTYSHPADRPAEWTRTPFTYSYDVELRTTGPNTVSFFNTAFGSGFLPLQTPAVSGFGGTALDIVFDENDNVISVNNPAPDARNRQFQLIPGGNSRYDEATKTLYLKMAMTQNGFDPIPMDIVMEFVRPRA